MGRPVNDLDFTTDARPEQVLELVGRPGVGATWTTGIEFGTVGAQVGGAAVRDHHLPGRPLRPGQPQPGGGVRRLARRTTCAGATSR